MHQERTNKHANDDAVPEGAVPAYLLDREGVSRAKVLSNSVKQKRKEKAGKWDVPVPEVSKACRFWRIRFHTSPCALNVHSTVPVGSRCKTFA